MRKISWDTAIQMLSTYDSEKHICYVEADRLEEIQEALFPGQDKGTQVRALMRASVNLVELQIVSVDFKDLVYTTKGNDDVLNDA